MEKIKGFLNNNGYGSGDGSGSGDGYGYGYGYGSGDGSGSGYSDCDGSGYGYGYGYGIKSVNGMLVHMIDHIPTIITNIHNNIASGFILNRDMTLQSCYIVRENNYFAHGETIKAAVKSLQKKITNNLSDEDKIKKFKETFPDFNAKYKAIELFGWHYLLTGSCEFGRKAFCQNNNIDIQKDKFTIHEFIELTKNEYQGEIIKQLLNN
jgi:hypothetical protein